MKLPKSSDIDHIFTFKFYSELLVDDHDDVDKVEAIDTYIPPGGIRMNIPLFNFEFLN
ncbi:MAG TPA: hypothetical protein VK994_05480 [Bacteroidales bacterium]|nr:hypothetical protein [Bacteroidales bacterium]